MSDSEKSCLVKQLEHYIDLDPLSADNLATMEKDERHYKKNEEIVQNNAANEYLYVVKHGWLYSHIDWGDGRRQIIKVHLPGDLIGFRDIAFDKVSTTLHTAEKAVLCPFPKSGMTPIFDRNPRLAAIFFAMTVRDQLSLIDIMKALGQMTAYERILFFILHMRSRLLVANKHLTDRIRIPLTQTEMGDVLGLTNVSVSRTIAELEKDGLIERSANWFILKKYDDMIKLTEFQNRYAKIDTSWFPKARPL